MDSESFVKCLDELLTNTGKKVEFGSGIHMYEVPSTIFDDVLQLCVCVVSEESDAPNIDAAEAMIRLTYNRFTKCRSNLCGRGWIFIASHRA